MASRWPAWPAYGDAGHRPGHPEHGIQVARLAGLPHEVVERARELLGWAEGPPSPRPAPPDTSRGPDLLREILSLDLANMTPLEALNKLAELQQKGRRASHPWP
jgi:DNA mismatch repair protein MutS